MFLSKLSYSTALSFGAHNLRRLGYKIRFAKPDDVKLMDACNRAVLPENYSADFYEQHMKCWPELTFVALTEDNEMVAILLLFRSIAHNDFTISYHCTDRVFYGQVGRN